MFLLLIVMGPLDDGLVVTGMNSINSDYLVEYSSSTADFYLTCYSCKAELLSLVIFTWSLFMCTY